jgi:integrase
MKTYDIIKLLNGFNANKSIKFGIRPCPSGYVLYLNNYTDGKMYRISTKMKITGTDKEYDLSVLKKAAIDRDNRELALLTGSNPFDKVESTTLMDFVNELAKSYPKFGYYHMSARLLVRYMTIDKKISELSEKDIEGFIRSLEVSNTTKHHYVFSIKHILNLAVKDGLITKNVASPFRIKCDQAKREFLTTEELHLVNDEGHCSIDTVKYAFLFSCFTGLRRSDLYELKWDNIKEGYLYIRQHKTKEVVRMKLNTTALEILDKVVRTTDKVFNLPTYKYVRQNLKQLIDSVNINKRITLHCARHTFATLLITYDTDIFTVSKLLGHTDVGTTLIYAKLVDKKKDEAIDRLPSL